MLTTAIVRHTPTLPLPHTQLNQYQLDLLSGLVLSPLSTTSHIVLEDILLSLHSHAIDNEHSALVPWTYNLFDCRQLLPLTSRLVASMSGLANNYSITTLYALYAHGTLERPLFGLTRQPAGRYPIGFVSGLAFISPLCIHASPCTLEDTITVHTVASLRPLRGLQFCFFYTLRPSNRHYFPSKSSSPSSQIQLPRKRRTFFAVFMAIELS